MATFRFGQRRVLCAALTLSTLAITAACGAGQPQPRQARADRSPATATATTVVSDAFDAAYRVIESNWRAESACSAPLVKDPKSALSIPDGAPVQPDGSMLVGPGLDCTGGRVSAEGLDLDLSHPNGEDQGLQPVHPVDGGTEVIGYWASGVGWLTPAQATSPTFDLEVYRAAWEKFFHVSR